MENLSPGLQLLFDVRTALENGTSVRTGVLNFLKLQRTDFNETVSAWILAFDQNQDTIYLLKLLHPCRRTLLLMLEKGMRGLPILAALAELEREIISSCELEMEERIQKLPIRLLFPVLFFMFPAYLIILIGPFMLEIIKHWG
ncbi:MAG: hypothetical protein RJB66_1514 [Pseudomonadota bacterium]|jgi:hypothetical protein